MTIIEQDRQQTRQTATRQTAIARDKAENTVYNIMAMINQTL